MPARRRPTSGKIVTPEMVREEERAREMAEAAAKQPSAPKGLITDPSQVRPEDWPRGLDRPLLPGQEE